MGKKEKIIAVICAIAASFIFASLLETKPKNTSSPQEIAMQATVKKPVLSVQAPNATDAQKRQISNALESLNEACPLLSAWTLDIDSAEARVVKVNQWLAKQDKETTDGVYFARGWKDYVEVKVIVKSPPSVIPRDFYASGHHCTFRIGNDGIQTAKQPCLKICKGQGIDDPGKIWHWVRQ